MLDKLNEHLETIKRQQQEKQKWESKLASYKKELKEKERVQEFLKEQLIKEGKDVEKLLNPSFTYFLFTVIGKQEDRLDKEKQELLKARLKVDEVEKALVSIRRAIIDLDSKLKNLPDVDTIYQEIMNEKESMILNEESPVTEEYFALCDKVAELKAKETETEDAIKAGGTVLNTLNQALDSLGSAEDWGTWDLFGGGLISTAIKHNHIDDAKDFIHMAQTDLRSFQMELADIQLNEDLDIDISGLLTFADYFFDGFITDWMVQGRIDDSIAKIEYQVEKINRLLSILNQNAESIRREMEQTALIRTALIEGA